MDNFYPEYTQTGITIILLGSLAISTILLFLPRKFLNYLNVILGFILFVISLITLNNRAISMHEATPFLIGISTYLFLFFVTDTFKISIKRQEKVTIVKE